MHGWTAEILPSLEALGFWAYWIVGAAAMLEAWFVTGVVAPGTLIVDAGGALVRLGKLDFFDLVWFVAIGAALGGELGFWTGRKAGARLRGRWNPQGSAAYRRAETLFRHRGGMALVLGRFLGPVAGLASLAAALSGMEPRKFHLWNALSAIPYALVHVALGYAAGDILGRIGPQLTRVGLFVAGLVVVLALIWVISAQIRRGMPLLLAGLAALRDMVLGWPRVAALVERHPRTADFVARRLAIGPFGGLTLSVLVLAFAYLAVAWADTVIDFLVVPEVVATDERFARLMHAFWAPVPLRAFGLVTQLGHSTVVAAVLAGALAVLAVTRRWAALVQLCVALGGELIMVRLLKGTFARPRPELGYFLETSGSFPSGHAALSVAFWGTLFVIAWRERLLGPTAALVGAAITAFLIGFSRLYLIEHFLSDVVNGWLIGSLWLVIGLTLAEGLRARGWQPETPGIGARAAAVALGCLAAGIAVWQVAAADLPRAITQAPSAPPVLDPATAADTPALPLEVLTLDGATVTPVTVIVAARDLGTVRAALTAGGWTPVSRPTPGALALALWSDWRGTPDPGAPMLPLFWDSRPQDTGFYDPDGTAVVRLWDSGARTAAGQSLFTLALEPTESQRGGWNVAAAGRSLAAALQPAQETVVQRPAAGGQALDGTGWDWDGAVIYLQLTDR